MPDDKKPGSNVKPPIQPKDVLSYLSDSDTVPNTFGNSKVQEITHTMGTSIRPEQYKYLSGVSPFDNLDALNRANTLAQPWTDKLAYGLKQAGAGFISGFGQGVVNLLDISAWGNDTYQSSLFGISTKDMSDWSASVANNNRILRENPSSFAPSDFGWWMEQVGSAGTGLGMGFEALVETAAIEFATGGTGTAGALANLGKKIKSIFTVGGKAALIETYSAAKGLRSSATLFGILNRTNESRMDAAQSYNDITESLSQEKNTNGSAKYTKEQIHDYASAGAARDFHAEMLLLPLDILSYRTMVFNPISGTAEGLFEKGLTKVAGVFGKSALGKAAGWGLEKSVGMTLEGTEEAFQSVGQYEGDHYARVLGGMDDGTSFGERLGKYVQKDDFWNNFAGGVIGSPIIGGAMNITNKVITGNRAAKMTAAYQNYVQNVAKMDNDIANQIVTLTNAGKTKQAEILQRQFRASKALTALHMDAMNDKTDAFDAHVNFLSTTLGELNSGKTDALSDLGFANPTIAHVEYLKKSLQESIKDAQELKTIYDNVKDKYNKNFVPQVVNGHYQVNRLSEEKGINAADIAQQQSKLFQFGNLSPQGKVQHNAEYELIALQQERKRLIELFKKTEDPSEKANVESVMKANEDRIVQIKTTLDDIAKDESYDPKDRTTDNDILNSAVHDRDYLQSIYDREHIDNALMLHRRNLSLWNKPEYQKAKTEAAIKNAKTVQQVQATADAAAKAAKDGKVDEATQTAIDEKTQQLAANQAAAAITAQQEGNHDSEIDTIQKNKEVDLKSYDKQIAQLNPNDIHHQVQIEQLQKKKQDASDFYDNRINNLKTTAAIPGNGNMFADDSDLIDTIKGAAPTVKQGDPEATGNEAAFPDMTFNPASYDFDNAPEQAKAQVKEGVAGLIDKLGENPIFEDLVRHVMKVQGSTVAENIYNALKWGWEQNGKNVEDYQAIYNKLFQDPMTKLMGGLSSIPVAVTSTEVEAETEAVVKTTISQDNDTQEFTENGQPFFDPKITYTGYVTNESSPKLAFATRLSNLLRETDEQGNITVGHEYATDGLNVGDYVDSMPLLNPDDYTPGKELVARVPSNFMDIKIAVWNPDGTKGASMTFGQYVAQNNLKETDQEYKDKIPMIIYDKNAPKDKKGVAFVHDIGWYNENNFNIEKSEDMAAAIAHTRAIREAVHQSDDKSAALTITGKRQTTFEGLKLERGKEISLHEANPQAQLTVALTSSTLDTSKKNILFPNNETKLKSAGTPFLVGHVYDVRRYGLEDGVATYMHFPVIHPRIAENIQHTVLQAINVYANSKNTDKAIREKHDAVVAHIKQVMGLDILSEAGIKQYLKHFITILNTDNARTNADVEAQARATLRESTPYIAFIAGGNIVFGQANVVAFTKGGNKMFSFYINPNSPGNNGLGLSALTKPMTVRWKNQQGQEQTKAFENKVGWYQTNVNLEALNNNKPVVTIDKDLNTVTGEQYKTFVMKNLQTNVRSINIGTEEKPNYVTNIQPVITYDLTSNLEKAKTQPTNTEVAEAMVKENPVTEPVAQGAKTPEIDAKAQEIIDRAKKILGNDFLNDDELTMNPAVMTAEQRDEASEDVIRIAGLSPDQQFDVIDFMYNQIVPLVDKNNGRITKSEVRGAVDKALREVFEPAKQKLQEEVAIAEKLLADHPHLANSDVPKAIESYKQRIDKLNRVIKSDTLKELTQARVEKYSGITEERVKTEELEPDENPDGIDGEVLDDGSNNNGRDFWTDVLQENPEHRLTYAMRRLFGQILKYDAKGEPMKGFQGIPTYTGADVISRNLMMFLADTPSDFNMMMAKLENYKDAMPWMKEVIERLKGASQQSKMQFVTVMSNTSLRMKFTMLSFNRKTNSWNTKVYDTHLNGVADAVRDSWRTNLLDSMITNLVMADEDGNYILNDNKAKALINEFEAWKGTNLPSYEGDTQNLESIRKDVKAGTGVNFIPGDAALRSFFNTHLNNNTDRVRIGMKGQVYQVTKTADGKFRMEYLSQSGISPDAAGKEAVTKWLGAFGIVLSDKTVDELFSQGLLHNYKRVSFAGLFQDGADTNGLFGILNNRLKYLVNKTGQAILDEDGSSPLQDSVITSLANLESKYNTTNAPFAFRDNGKSFFALSIPKFITDRSRDLKDKNSSVRQELMSTSFSKNSLWLQLLDDDDFKTKFGISHIGSNAFKEMGKKLKRDNSISNLSEVDHELTKLGMFWDMNQGEVSFGKDASKNYPGTNIPMRMATMFSPTMSDKHMMTLVTTAVLNLGTSDLQGGKMTDEVAKVLYEQCVKPELERMIKFWQNGGKTDITGYDKGAAIFMLLPAMNDTEYIPGLKLIKAIQNNPNQFTLETIENNEDVMKSISDSLGKYVQQLTDEKLAVWKESGFVTTTVNGENVETELKFFNKNYIDKFRGDNTEKATMAAMDFVINNMISISNSFMTMAGDPAFYYKSKSNDPMKMSLDSFVNVGKRLANQIAPGTALADSQYEKYIQLFINDRKSLAETSYLKFSTKINDGHEITDAELEILNNYYKQINESADNKPNPDTKAAFDKIVAKYPISAGYFEIEGSDAQEYTTWKEHLDILSKLGKTPDALMEITPEEIDEARNLLSSGTPLSKMTDVQQQLIGKVMQPIKPVYTGQVFDPKQDVMRTVYIKSSSFPLIEALTAGTELDKLRIAMEKIQDDHKMNVRASYQTANKVGSMNNAINLWSHEGRVNEDALNKIADTKLVLDRKNFRIQQEVPFKSGKTGEDKISLGTQLMKLLFGDEIMKYSGFELDGKTMDGKELHQIYNDTFINLVQQQKQILYSELGLDEQGKAISPKATMAKLQEILKEEAIKRGYPLQDINGLKLVLSKDEQSYEFNMPLWASTNSNRYESMLNSIIGNRMVRMKFPGNSFVVGSEEGFKMQEESDNLDKSRIIMTSAWNGSHLEASYHSNGKVKKAQVFVGSKFKGPDGKLIDLLEKVGGKYKYIVETDKGFRLNEGMFDKELLAFMTFRIPTSGHQSASQVEIAGFIPFASADLMIVPRNFTKQKGLDFDVDKENSYSLWTHMNAEGKFEVLQEKHRAEILAEADKEYQKALRGEAPGKLFANIVAGMDYTADDLKDDPKLKKLNDKISAKLMQNTIIKIHNSVYNNPHSEIQSKINKTLNTGFAESEADFIEGLSANSKNNYWTPLSDEYQKQKLISGASGKIGTGAYSLDVVFHSLVQQAAMRDKGLRLITINSEDGIDPKEMTFGNVRSDGTLGRATTLDGGRSIAEVMAERQNVAVDNEKLQIMGRVNLNDLTMDVDKVFNLLGFDKGEDGHSISMLFLSQPIIKEYVKRMKNANSNVAEFVANREKTIVEALINENKVEGAMDIDNEDYWKVMSAQMSNPNLISALKADKPDGALQVAVLRRFMEMKQYGLAIRNIQTTINVDSKGLGKSFFDVIERRNNLNKLGDMNGLVQGATDLIGDYITRSSVDLSEEKRLAKEGYVNIGRYLVKPDTLSGGFSVHGVGTAYDMWGEHFPYDKTMVEKVFNEIIPIATSGVMSDSAMIQLKQKIFQGIKRYVATTVESGIVSRTDNVNKERERLFIDSADNTSLATYVKTLLATNGNTVIDKYIKRNNLINRFEFKIEKNGLPSLIKFNNAAGEEFDEQYLYESLATLMENRGKDGSIKLPKIGNKEYTLDTLAQDLVAYSMLGNAIQEAVQFTKYVPMSYLNTVGYSATMRRAGGAFETNANILRIRNLADDTPPERRHLISEFALQFFQHNPESVAAPWKMNTKEFAKRTTKVDDNTVAMKGDDRPTLISVYDPSLPKGEKKFSLYWFDGKNYVRVPVLGTFGMDEYQRGHEIGDSLVNGKLKNKINPTVAERKATDNTSAPTNTFKVGTGTIHEVVSAIAENNSTQFAELAKTLLPYVSSETTIKVVDKAIVNGKEYTNFSGYYDKDTRTIYLNSNIMNSPDKLAENIMHELVHDLTQSEILKHTTANADGTVNVAIDAPAHVVNLVRVFNTLRAEIDNNKIAELNTRLKSGLTIIDEMKSNYYGYRNLAEFVSMALTDKGFQEILSKIPFKDTGMSFLERFKQVITQVMEALGVKFNENSAAHQALNSIFDFIDNTNVKSDNTYDSMENEMTQGNADSKLLNELDDLIGDGPKDMTLNPKTTTPMDRVQEFISNLTDNEINC